MNSSPAYLDADLTGRIIGAFFQVYRDLGHGFAEAVYERALADTLEQVGLRATRYEIGLLLNFGPRPQIKRLIFSNDRKRHLPPP